MKKTKKDYSERTEEYKSNLKRLERNKRKLLEHEKMKCIPKSRVIWMHLKAEVTKEVLK